MIHKTVIRFLRLALIMLVAGIFFGVIGGIQYVFPVWLKNILPFTNIRPLHVTLVISWIFTAATAGIYYYLPRITGEPLFSMKMARLHLVLLVITTCMIIGCYFMGRFGGREYLEFPPWLAVPMILYWILFMINYFRTIRRKFFRVPIYLWMWSTGLIFFLLTFAEAYLWMIPWFRDNIVRDITVQWKAMGAMVGSWNMMVYGTGFYVMEKISGDDKVTRSPFTFFFYFLGLTNLMFNWGHHTYIVPASGWIKSVSYIISMTELLILGNIIYFWSHTLSKARKNFHIVPYRFLSAADAWIFLNLCLAIIISVPEINYFTHGTHITVAHAMGATIGINTMILLASMYFIAEQESPVFVSANFRWIRAGFWITNISLLLFWIALIGAGIVKALDKNHDTLFQQMMSRLAPWFGFFSSSGLVVFAGIVIVVVPLFKIFSTRSPVAEASKKLTKDLL
ncbi:MAG: cbb3-type cytochrome c oxidase subunit I [Bacteroidetes bacterium]|nr:cbb3-type cytochrome c oxidase subunit I [Bacteroidota bacterium]